MVDELASIFSDEVAAAQPTRLASVIFARMNEGLHHTRRLGLEHFPGAQTTSFRMTRTSRSTARGGMRVFAAARPGKTGRLVASKGQSTPIHPQTDRKIDDKKIQGRSVSARNVSEPFLGELRAGLLQSREKQVDRPTFETILST